MTLSMGFGIYVHIPYCVQRCSYCDFTTFEQSAIMPPEQYVKLLLTEINNLAPVSPYKEVRTIYFGGGTPSLIPPEHIVSIIEEIANQSNLNIEKDVEITIEINPATISESSLDLYLKAGVNRFSVGAQTFNDTLLKSCGRIHSANDTVETLKLLDRRNLNYSFDLLFALPGQSLVDLKRDLEVVNNFNINHISTYCLTVPSGHPMEKGRPMEETQVQMFQMIRDELGAQGFEKYEISNFARPGFRSRHNSIYWSDDPYWGIGISSHSYFPSIPGSPYGVRFWNPKDFKGYSKHTESREWPFSNGENSKFFELLHLHEAMTDYCHIHLRTLDGIFVDRLRHKFPKHHNVIEERLKSCLNQGLLINRDGRYFLSTEGETISNRVFSELTFLKNEASGARL